MLHTRASIVHTSGTTAEHSRRMLKKAVQQGRRRVETGGVPSVGYVEDFDEPRTTLAGFFSILLKSGQRLMTISRATLPLGPKGF
jgi:hypothetical protein